jgi:hypothetical protein
VSTVSRRVGSSATRGMTTEAVHRDDGVRSVAAAKAPRQFGNRSATSASRLARERYAAAAAAAAAAA